jgi:hypothetical protein
MSPPNILWFNEVLAHLTVPPDPPRIIQHRRTIRRNHRSPSLTILIYRTHAVHQEVDTQLIKSRTPCLSEKNHVAALKSFRFGGEAKTDRGEGIVMSDKKDSIRNGDCDDPDSDVLERFYLGTKKQDHY